ncbi:uncharacterized protein LOC129276576 [Lytechinus pictus]|uniref:uncharacterized protein LOC129276576 n=1 Tax=Lytechinus pictus TaxID=7653 RepID=UPI0030B9F354
MNPIEYEQHLRFMQLYNAAVATQEQDLVSRSLRRMRRHNSYTHLGPTSRSYPPPVRRADSSGQLEINQKGISRTSSESGYNSNLEHRRLSRSLDRGLTKRSSTLSDSGAYEGYPRVRRVSVIRKDSDIRPPTPPIIKRKSSSTRSNDSMTPSVRFSTVEDIMAAYGHGNSWSGRYKPRHSIDRESHISAHSMKEYDDRQGRRSSSVSRGHDDFDGGRRSSREHRKKSSSSSRYGRRPSVPGRRASVSSRRSSIASGSRRPSITNRVSYNDEPRVSIVNPNGIEGAEIMQRLSRVSSELKEWERSLIMSRRNSAHSRRSSNASRRRSTSGRRRSSVGDSTSSSSDSSSDSDSDSDSDSSSSGSGTTDSDSDSSSSSGSDSESDSETDNGKERKSSNSTSAMPNNNGNGGNDVADGGRTAQTNGGMAFAMDGAGQWERSEPNNSSSLCVIL